MTTSRATLAPGRSATSSVTPSGAGYRIELAGTFDHPHWLAFLFAGLGAADVSIVSGRATRAATGEWAAGLDVRGDAPHVRDLDPVLLASTRPVRRDPHPPRLTSSTLTRRADGLLDLVLTAPDEVGFLGRLLGRISVLTLLPVEAEISTAGSLVSDRFVLAGLRSGALDEDVSQALSGMLRGFSGERFSR